MKNNEIKGDIVLREVSATAGGGRVDILHGISTTFRPGELAVIIGPSGAGKSTLMRSLLGIWPETKGAVIIDGVPVDQYSRQELGSHIGYLPQDVELFEGTIAENIARFGEVDSSNVIEASKMVGVHEMILRFPKGYDTPVGEGGRVLSAGQRQRIALARAIHCSPAILVLDEPNANLDESGDSALRSVVRELADRGSTVVMITHRSHILETADRIVVMEKGKIVRDGGRREVLESMKTEKENRKSVSVI